jgi:hypothetical protein
VRSWRCQGSPLEQFIWSGLYGIAPSLVDPLKATASAHDGWLYRVGQTVDGNVTWTIMNSAVGPNDLARDPVWEDRLFGANEFGGVQISLDGGVTWNDCPLDWTSSLAVVLK